MIREGKQSSRSRSRRRKPLPVGGWILAPAVRGTEEPELPPGWIILYVWLCLCMCVCASNMCRLYIYIHTTKTPLCDNREFFTHISFRRFRLPSEIWDFFQRNALNRIDRQRCVPSENSCISIQKEGQTLTLLCNNIYILLFGTCSSTA